MPDEAWQQQHNCSNTDIHPGPLTATLLTSLAGTFPQVQAAVVVASWVSRVLSNEAQRAAEGEEVGVAQTNEAWEMALVRVEVTAGRAGTAGKVSEGGVMVVNQDGCCHTNHVSMPERGT